MQREVFSHSSTEGEFVRALPLNLRFKRTPGELDLVRHESDSQSLSNKMQAKKPETSSAERANAVSATASYKLTS